MITTAWLRIELQNWTRPPGTKTRKWFVISRENGATLGFIAWHPPWRRYVFAPEPETVFEERCLRDLADVIEAFTKQQRATWKRRTSP